MTSGHHLPGLLLVCHPVSQICLYSLAWYGNDRTPNYTGSQLTVNVFITVLDFVQWEMDHVTFINKLFSNVKISCI